MPCPVCGTDNPTGRKFCGECGNPLAQACPNCGTPIGSATKFCGECGTPLTVGTTSLTASPAAAQPVREHATAERRLVSVLFADLVGFTTLSESRDAEEVRELLSKYFDTCKTLISRYGGVVEKFIGDAVMAVWGAPVATEDDAERAVRAALDLTSAVAELGEEAGAPDLRARAGVLTGEAAVTIGAEGQGMVAGDLVNTRVAHPVGRRARDGPRRRVHETSDRGDDRLRGRRRVRAEGQGRVYAPMAGPQGRFRRPRLAASRQAWKRRSSDATASCA